MGKIIIPPGKKKCGYCSSYFNSIQLSILTDLPMGSLKQIFPGFIKFILKIFLFFFLYLNKYFLKPF